MVRCRLMTDSNRLKIVQPNVLSSHMHCLKRLYNSSNVTLLVCFYCFTHKSKAACPLLFNLHLSKMSSYVVKLYRGNFTAFSGFGLTIKAHASSKTPSDCISQDAGVKLLHLDCNTELTVSLLLLGKQRYLCITSHLTRPSCELHIR